MIPHWRGAWCCLFLRDGFAAKRLGSFARLHNWKKPRGENDWSRVTNRAGHRRLDAGDLAAQGSEFFLCNDGGEWGLAADGELDQFCEVDGFDFAGISAVAGEASEAA